VLVGGPPSAFAGGGPTITVTLGDGSQHVVTLDDGLTRDRPSGTFINRIVQRRDDTKFIPTGWSVRSVLIAAGADPDTTYSVTITGTVGGPVVLHTEDFADAAVNHAFVQGQGVPLFYWQTEGQPQFFRPERDVNDLNGLDDIVGTDGNLGAQLESGAILHVTAHANRTKVDPGQPVSFTSSVQGAHRDETLTYKWNFGDGRTSSAANPSHVFTTGGRIYSVNLTVTGEGSGGSAPVLKITVGHKSGGSGSGGDNHGHSGSGAPSGPNGTGGTGTKTSTTGGNGTASQPAGQHHATSGGGGGVRVTGVLISGTSAQPAPAAPQRAFGIGGTDTPGPAIGGVVSGVLAVGLSAFGAYRETRRPLLRPASTRPADPPPSPPEQR